MIFRQVGQKQSMVNNFNLAPFMAQDQPGFEHLLDRIESKKPLVFCKLNHGFWERLARVVTTGIFASDLVNTTRAQIDGLLNLTDWATTGVIHNLLNQMPIMNAPDSGLIFVPSLSP